jgi:GTP-binding protein YchF
MKIALIGPPQSGKTMLFEAVTGQFDEPGYGTQEALAVVKVPDPRLDVLAKAYHPKRVTPATVEFVDVPGFSQVTAQQQAEFRRHIPSLKQCDGLVAVARSFANDSVPAYRDRIDPKADLEELHAELIFADLETATNRIERLDKALSKPTRTHEQEKRERVLLERCCEKLEAEAPVADAIESDEERKLVRGFQFLTEKPLIVVVNVSDSEAAAPKLFEYPSARAVIGLCARMEAEIAQLDPGDRQAFLDDLGVPEPARDRLVQTCYEALGLVSFLTFGDEEVRAWSVPIGTPAVEAAGKVHTDMARGFIRAETIAFEDFAAAGDMKAAKAAGKVRLEGKNYIVQDGDCITFRFNV